LAGCGRQGAALRCSRVDLDAWITCRDNLRNKNSEEEMSLADVIAGIPIVKDIASVVIPIFGVYVAWTGLNTWKKQLTANAERDLARRVLIAVYKVRDAVHRIITFAELVADKEAPSEAAQKILKEKIVELEQTCASLDIELLEAEAVWGDEIIYNASFTLFRSRVALFDNKATDDQFIEQMKQDIERIEDLLRFKLKLK
jgi:hypothetical protein